MNNQTKGFALVFLSAFCFSILPIFGKMAYSIGVSPFNLLAWRFVMAAVAIWLLAVPLVGKQLLVKKKDLFHFTVQGVFGYGFASIGYFVALTYLNASLVSILLYTYPALVTLFSRVVFKERLTVKRLVVIVITFIGSLLVTNILQSTPNHIVWPGILFGLLAAFAYSLFNLYSQKTTAASPPLVVSTYSITALAITFVLLAPHQEFLHPSLKLLGIGAVIGIVSTVLPIVTYLGGIKLIGASKSAIISTFEPVFTIILAYIFLSESLSLSQTLGSLLIFGGVVALQLGKKTTATEEPAALPVSNSVTGRELNS